MDFPSLPILKEDLTILDCEVMQEPRHPDRSASLSNNQDTRPSSMLERTLPVVGRDRGDELADLSVFFRQFLIGLPLFV